MAEVENYVRTEFVTDFLKAPQTAPRPTACRHEWPAYTGIDPVLVRRLDGRVDIATYLREIRRNTGQIGSVYDSNVTAYDPFPASADANYNDPLLDGIIAPTTSAAVDFITNQVGWKSRRALRDAVLRGEQGLGARQHRLSGHRPAQGDRQRSRRWR